MRAGAIVWPGYECLFLARKLGLLEGEPIKLVEYPNTPEMLRAFRNGALEVAAMSGDEFLREAAEEPGLRAFLVTDISHGADAIVGHPNVNRLEDLRGRRVGVEVNSMGVFMLTRSLAAVGMTARDVEVVAVETDLQLAAFKAREVEAMVCFDPNRTRLLKQGGRVLFDSTRIPGEIVDLLVARESVIRERPDHLRTLVVAWFKAREHLFAKPADSAALIAAREGLSSEELLGAFRLLKIPTLDENRRLLGPQGGLLKSLESLHGFMSQAGHLAGKTPSASLLTQELLS